VRAHGKGVAHSGSPNTFTSRNYTFMEFGFVLQFKVGDTKVKPPQDYQVRSEQVLVVPDMTIKYQFLVFF
jgi:hypothetical protein